MPPFPHLWFKFWSSTTNVDEIDHKSRLSNTAQPRKPMQISRFHLYAKPVQLSVYSTKKVLKDIEMHFYQIAFSRRRRATAERDGFWHSLHSRSEGSNDSQNCKLKL